METSTSTLAVGLDTETMERVLPLLSGRDLAVECVPLARQAVQRATQRRYDLVVSAYPLPDMVLREFGDVVRHRSSASRDAALLVLTLPEMCAEARRVLRGGRSLVMSRRDPRLVLADAVRHLLQVEPRRRPEATVTLRLEKDGAPAEIVASLANLSRSGMLVRQDRLPLVGTRCDFELRFAGHDDDVRGSGEVVRHSSPSRERVLGFALRFLHLDEGSQQLLDAGLSARN